MTGSTDDIVSIAKTFRALASRASEAPWIASDDSEPRRVCTGSLRTYDNIVFGHDAAGRSACLSVENAAFVAYARNNAQALCDGVTELAESVDNLNEALRVVAHHGAVIALNDGSKVVRGHPWVDAPTHEGFWWLLTPDGKRDVVRVAFFGTSREYVEINDTHGRFGVAPDGARWQAIDTPAVPAAREETR